MIVDHYAAADTTAATVLVVHSTVAHAVSGAYRALYEATTVTITCSEHRVIQRPRYPGDGRRQPVAARQNSTPSCRPLRNLLYHSPPKRSRVAEARLMGV